MADLDKKISRLRVSFHHDIYLDCLTELAQLVII